MLHHCWMDILQLLQLMKFVAKRLRFIIESCSSCVDVDMGSQFRMEYVIYMSSCATTIFIGSLVIVRILLMTLLIALTVMLQSRQSREVGVLESFKSDHHRYEHCKMVVSHAEINSFKGYSLHEFCKDVVNYIKEGHYMRELNISVSLVENYFNGITPDDGGRDVVLMDTDDFLPADTLRSNPLLYGFHMQEGQSSSSAQLIFRSQQDEVNCMDSEVENARGGGGEVSSTSRISAVATTPIEGDRERRMNSEQVKMDGKAASSSHSILTLHVEESKEDVGSESVNNSSSIELNIMHEETFRSDNTGPGGTCKQSKMVKKHSKNQSRRRRYISLEVW